jgi:hypothetical protein
MTISDKTRKLLWGRSGNRCAFCKHELVMIATQDDDAIVGDECHIHAKHTDGPRSNSSMSTDELDDYTNLILLCKVHHKMVDDQPNTYTIEYLRNLKKSHETWVSETLHKSLPQNKRNTNDFLIRIDAGKELFSIVAGAHFFDLDYDEPENRDEIDFLKDFVQNLTDWGDIGDTIESGEKVEISYELTQDIKELESKGFVIFGARITKKLKFNNVVDTWIIATIRILRNTNPSIIKIDLSEQKSG